MKEQIVYVRFYLAGDCIFKCQKAWLSGKDDIEWKKSDLAEQHNTDPSLITTDEEIMEVPIPNVLDKLLDGTGVVISKKR